MIQVFGKNLDFLFIYLTTMNHEVAEQIEDGGSKCLFLDRDAASQFLGPFLDIYRVATSIVENSNEGAP